MRRNKVEDRVPGLATNILAWVVYLFLLLPSLIVVPMSFGSGSEFDFPPSTLSLDLYREYFLDKSWLNSTLISLQVAVASSLLSLVFGGLAAYAVVRNDFRGKQALTMFLLSPMLVPSIVLALALYLYLGIARLTGTTYGLILCHVVVCMPFVIVTMMSGLRQIDANLETAATIMGARPLTVLRRVTIPLLKPTIIAAGLFAFLISFDEVVISFFVSGVRTQTLPVKMYSTIHWEISPVLAAVSSILTACSLGVCVLVAALQEDQK